jgi:hypothetical protein
VKRSAVGKSVKDKIFSVVRSVFKNIAGESVLSEWNRMRVEPPRTVDSTVAVKIDDYLAYWGKTTYENLTAAITRVVETNPTEAECERAFSVIKYAFPRLRMRSNEDLVEATLLGASAVGFLRNYEFDGDEPKTTKPKDEAVQEEEKISVALTGDAAMALIVEWEKTQADPEPDRRRVRKESPLCGECKKDDKHHPEGERWVKCCSCTFWFAFSCVGIAEEDYIQVEQAEKWTCADCQ